MRNNLRHILVLLLAAPLLFWGINTFTKKIYADKFEVSINIKAYRTLSLCMLYNEVPNDFKTDKSDSKIMNATQFYARKNFEVPDAANTKYLQFRMAADTNQVFIDGISLIVKGAFKDTTIRSWKGKDIRKVIASLHGTEISAENIFYLQFSVSEDDPSITFNDAFYNEIQTFYKHDNIATVRQLTASIVLTIFCLAMLFFFLSSHINKPVRESVHGGGVLIGSSIFIIAAIFLNNNLGLIDEGKGNENRQLAKKPELKLDNFFSFPDAYANYARDNFSFRNALFHTHSLYMAKVFNTSPMPEDVLLGKNGWFFDTESGCLDDYRRTSQVSEGELAQIFKSMIEKKKWLDDRHIRFYVMVPPNKHMVYPENMPAGYFQTAGIGVSRVDAYRDRLTNFAGINFIDPLPALVNAKAHREVYYSSDTHWNLYGGFIAYTELMKVMCKDFPYMQPAKEADFNFTTFKNSEGDLARVAGLQDLYQRTEQVMTFKDPDKKLVRPAVSDIVIRYEDNQTVDSSRLKLFMLRDSYSNYLIPFLNLHFKKSLYLWSYDFPDKLIEQEKPDVVIFESLERFMTFAFANPNPESMVDTSLLHPRPQVK